MWSSGRRNLRMTVTRHGRDSHESLLMSTINQSESWPKVVLGSAILIIVAVIAYFGAIQPTNISIQATQTKEAVLTSLVMSVTPTPSPIVPTHSPSPTVTSTVTPSPPVPTPTPSFTVTPTVMPSPTMPAPTPSPTATPTVTLLPVTPIPTPSPSATSTRTPSPSMLKIAAMLHEANKELSLYLGDVSKDTLDLIQDYRRNHYTEPVPDSIRARLAGLDRYWCGVPALAQLVRFIGRVDLRYHEKVGGDVYPMKVTTTYVSFNQEINAKSDYNFTVRQLEDWTYMPNGKWWMAWPEKDQYEYTIKVTNDLVSPYCIEDYSTVRPSSPLSP